MTNTRDRLLEAKYFLERMMEKQSYRDAFKYNLSAFLSAARSVTLIMQKEFNNKPGFAEWYCSQQAKMKADRTMKILCKERNITIHQQPIHPQAHIKASIAEHITITETVLAVLTHADGTVERYKSASPTTPASLQTESTVKWHWYFEKIPGDDVVTVCQKYIKEIETIVTECERQFVSLS